MYEIEETERYKRWFASLRDRQAKGRIVTRIRRLSEGHLGDVKWLGDQVGEIRLHFGPGYRIYFKRRGQTIVVLLCGGDKSSQQSDITMALQLAERT